MNELQHKLWIDSINFHIQEGLPLEEAVAKAKALANTWPFRTVNGEQTPESVALETMKQPKPLTGYAKVMSDPETEECLL